MTVSITPTQSDVLAALRSFLTSVLPAVGSDGKAVDVVAAVVNRVPEPIGADFAIMTILRFPRLATNVDDGADCRYVGAIAGAVLTVTSLSWGEVRVGAPVYGVGVADGTVVGPQIAGVPGGAGTYAVSPSQTIGSRVLSSGQRTAAESTEVVVQVDVHTGDGRSADMAQAIANLMRDPYAPEFFAALPSPRNRVSPLYADDPRFLPWQNEQQQIEWRWVVECHLQVTQVAEIGQQYADVVTIDVVSVDATYPP